MSTGVTDPPKPPVPMPVQTPVPTPVPAGAGTPKKTFGGPVPLNYGMPKEPWTSRINIRMIVFAAVLLLLIGYPVYVYVDAAVHNGVKSHGSYLEVDLKAMGNFPFDAVNGTAEDVPPQYRALDGKRVQLEGEVWAPDEAGDHMSRFELVYSIAKCCFGGPPKVQERVFAIVPKDLEVQNLTYQYATVTGVLHIKAQKEGDQVASLYTLDVEKVVAK